MPPLADWKQSRLRSQSAGEGAFFVAEQFAFDQRGDQRSAVHGHERTVGQSAAEMNGAGDQFLAGSAFAGNQDRSARVLEARDQAQHVLNFGGRTDDAVQGGFGFDAFAEKLILFDQADFFGHAAQEKAQFLERRKRLADVIVGAELHGLHGGFNRAVAGHDRDLDAGKKLLHLLQETRGRTCAA